MRLEHKCIDKTTNPVTWSKEKFQVETHLNAVTLNGFKYLENKPILIPLEKFKDINSPEMSESNFDIIAQMELCELANERIGYWGLTYGVAKICFEQHIDIFNLIPQGLAVGSEK